MTSTLPAPVSYWLEELGALTTRPPLAEDLDADVVIVGAGFSGLWTAWHLLERDAELRIIILEAEHVGFGATGRNGGWCSSNMGLSAPVLAKRYGREGALRVIDTMRESVDAIGATEIPCDYRKNGLFYVARGQAQVPSLRHSYETLVELGRADGVEWLDEDDARSYLPATRVVAGLRNAHGANVQPAKLAHGLAERLESRGVRIFERSPVVRVSPRAGPAPALAETATGSVAAPVVTLSPEAWLASVGEARTILPVYSLIVLTEPLSAERWEAIGWSRGECLASYQLTVDYLTKTPDGRIMFGGRGAPYHYGSRISPAFDRHEPTFNKLRAAVAEWWPALSDVKFTHAWGGPLGIPRDLTPNVGFDPQTGIGRAFGYVGQGVSTSYVGGRYLAADILGQLHSLRPLPFVGHRSRRWEPEPARWLAARYIQSSFARLDRKAELSGRPPSGRSLAERLYPQ